MKKTKQEGDYSFGNEILKALLIWPISPILIFSFGFLPFIDRRSFFISIVCIYFALMWGAIGWTAALGAYFSHRKKYLKTHTSIPITRYSYVISALILGYFGIHNFYAKYFKRGFLQLCLCLIGIILAFAIAYTGRSFFGNKFGFYSAPQDFIYNFVLPFICAFISIILNIWIIIDILTVKRAGNGASFPPSPHAPYICALLSILFMLFFPLSSGIKQGQQMIKEYHYIEYDKAYYIRRLKDRTNEVAYWNGDINTCTDYLKPLPFGFKKCFFYINFDKNGQSNLTILLPELDDDDLDKLSEFFRVSKDEREIFY